jgi:hypothetical protein
MLHLASRLEREPRSGSEPETSFADLVGMMVDGDLDRLALRPEEAGVSGAAARVEQFSLGDPEAAARARKAG